MEKSLFPLSVLTVAKPFRSSALLYWFTAE